MQSISYCSGAGNITDLEALIDAGVAIGVELGRLDGPARSCLIDYAISGGKVMVDSGAFGAFKKGLSVDFETIMTQYEQLVWATKGRITIVAPDVIGSQPKTFALLETYKEQLRRFISMGTTVMVPLQKGEMPPYQAWQHTKSILGTDNFIVAIPSNKQAFTELDLLNLLDGKEKPARIHFLGMTKANRQWERKRNIVMTFSPDTQVSMDGCRLIAMVGKGRAVTTTQAETRGEIVEKALCGSGPLSHFEDGGDMPLELLESGDLSDAEVHQLFVGIADLSEIEGYIEANHKGELAEQIDDDLLLSDIFNWRLNQLLSSRAGKKAGPIARHEAIVQHMKDDITTQSDNPTFSRVAIQMQLF